MCYIYDLEWSPLPALRWLWEAKVSERVRKEVSGGLAAAKQALFNNSFFKYKWHNCKP